MTTSVFPAARSARPAWFWIAAGLGLAWNVFGLFQFAGSLTSSVDSLMEAGMTAEQAAVMKSYPLWMTIAFAIGTLGGTLGCCLLLMRSAYATNLFWLSLVAYIGLYIGDYTKACSLLWAHLRSSSSRSSLSSPSRCYYCRVPSQQPRQN